MLDHLIFEILGRALAELVLQDVLIGFLEHLGSLVEFLPDDTVLVVHVMLGQDAVVDAHAETVQLQQPGVDDLLFVVQESESLLRIVIVEYYVRQRVRLGPQLRFSETPLDQLAVLDDDGRVFGVRHVEPWEDRRYGLFAGVHAVFSGLRHRSVEVAVRHHQLLELIGFHPDAVVGHQVGAHQRILADAHDRHVVLWRNYLKRNSTL